MSFWLYLQVYDVSGKIYASDLMGCASAISSRPHCAAMRNINSAGSWKLGLTSSRAALMSFCRLHMALMHSSGLNQSLD